ncbi:unnamed protein product [Prorocentrum cordatum]|uniref:Uncharacterized protein n=1 Tax=Prorocentrum cordatum TaxID=2364126 RepID=A0ABN9VK25_9DINO|nr:unnamed protein product [Polarella glacialis]
MRKSAVVVGAEVAAGKELGAFAAPASQCAMKSASQKLYDYLKTSLDLEKSDLKSEEDCAQTAKKFSQQCTVTRVVIQKLSDEIKSAKGTFLEKESPKAKKILIELRSKCLQQLSDIQLQSFKVPKSVGIILRTQEQFKLAIGCRLMQGTLPTRGIVSQPDLLELGTMASRAKRRLPPVQAPSSDSDGAGSSDPDPNDEYIEAQVEGPHSEYPVLSKSIKAAQQRCLAPVILELIRDDYDDGTDERQWRTNCLKNLNEYYQVIDGAGMFLTTEEYARLESAVEKTLVFYGALASKAMADSKYKWSTVNKHHFYFHLGGLASQPPTIPLIGGELTTPAKLHAALAPAWRSLVEQRNAAGLVAPKALQALSAEARGARAAAPGEAEARGPEAAHLPAALEPGLRYPDGSTPLHFAAAFGLEASVRSLAGAGADVSAVAGTGLQPIHAAAIMGHAAVAQLLVESGADVDARHGFAGNTPLHFAAEMGHAAVVRRLCELGADAEAEKTHGGVALHVTADTNNAQVARTLLAHPCNARPDPVLLGDTVPLYLAAGRGFPEVIRVLLEAGANPDRTLWPERPWAPTGRGGKGRRRRRKAVEPDARQALQASVDPATLNVGSDPRAPGWEAGNGATALHNACENGHLAAASALLDGGARQLATMGGITPLISALQYRHPRVAAALLDHPTPANVGVVSPADGQTALHIASGYGYPEVVARILREGGSADVPDRRGSLAADYAKSALIARLLDRFRGREPRLDRAVRERGGAQAEDLAARLDASPGRARGRPAAVPGLRAPPRPGRPRGRGDAVGEGAEGRAGAGEATRRGQGGARPGAGAGR